VIDEMIEMSVRGQEDFQPSWTYQTPEYDREVILQRECRYFIEAFLNGYLGNDIAFEDLREEFEILADRISEFATIGFMHRDFQSRNIMMKQDKCYFIDFQGGRIGPVQYDLASLLIDPYVNLNEHLQEKLLCYCIDRLGADETRFRKGYDYCCLSRNLQMLGAFGHLLRVKHKTFFGQYIPIAFKGLKQRLSKLGQSRLKQAVEMASACFGLYSFPF
jgi:aminoglycoside/choline kinase family phosphotransferase